MLKQIIFTAVLVIVLAFSFYAGLKPFGPLADWQDISIKHGSEPEKEIECEEECCQNPKKWRTIHDSLNDKTDQIMKVWGTLQSVQGNVNVLHTTDVKAVYPNANPLEILVPINNSLTKVSGLFRWALSALVFERMLLVFSVYLVFLVLVPICALMGIYHIWTYKDKNNLHKVVIVSGMIILVISLVIPVSLKLSTITDEKLMIGSIEIILTSMEEIDKKNDELNSELRRFRRTEAAINGYLSTSRDLSDAVIKDAVKYLNIFLMINLLIPVILIILFYKLTRFYSKKILSKY